MKIKMLSELEEEDEALFGRKALKLAFLSKRKFFSKNGFSVSFDFFDEFLKDSSVFEFLNQKITTISSEKDATKLSNDVRAYVQMSSIDEDKLNSILDFYHSLTISSENKDAERIVNSSSDPLVVLRLSYSDSIKENVPAIRNIKGDKEVERSIIEAFSYLFSVERIIEIARTRRLPRIALIFQEMVMPEKSGFCRVSKGKEIQIFSSFGFIDSIKKGETKPDSFKLSFERFEILDRFISKKDFGYFNNSDYRIEKRPISEEDAEDPSLSNRELNQLFETAKRISIFLKSSVDFEWALTSEGLQILNYEVKNMEEKNVFEMIFDEDELDESSDNENKISENESEQIRISQEINEVSSSEEYSEEKDNTKDEEKNNADIDLVRIKNAMDKIIDKYAKINPSLKDILALYKEDLLEELKRN
ncbi:MAG: Pyruvate phosphate dikinase, AMP/ATP-binding domain [Candidatus Woesearchaeota archaeon]|nr:Pyruvate phosphate dikinase, AMP/ATP-binding domain [Candidatus Woesearchaeota archaeon]